MQTTTRFLITALLSLAACTGDKTAGDPAATGGADPAAGEKPEGGAKIGGVPTSREGQMYLLGQKLSQATMVNGHVDAAVVARAFKAASTVADLTLKAQLAPLPTPTGDRVEDTATAMHYLLKGQGAALGKQIKAEFGEAAASTYELAVKINMLPSLYVDDPRVSVGDTMAEVFGRLATRAKLPDTAMGPLIAKLVARAPTREVTDMALDLNKTLPVVIAEIYEKTDSSPGAAAPTSAARSPAADDEAAAIARAPKQRLAIEKLGLNIEVPEGTTVTPPYDAASATRRANLKRGAFMVNVSAVDDFSTPTFAKAQEIAKGDKLVARLQADATPSGWITFNEVVSSLHQSNRFEVTVRADVGGKPWDCSISAPNRPLAELALTACQTLSANRAEASAAASKSVKSARRPSAKPASKPSRPTTSSTASVQVSGGSSQGALDKAVIARVVRRQFGRIRLCYERALTRNPKLEVTVTTTFLIGGNGAVSAASTAGADGDLTGCVSAVFRGLTFPQPMDGKPVKASYPIRFSPGP